MACLEFFIQIMLSGNFFIFFYIYFNYSLYDANVTLDRPCSQLDFNILLPDRTPSESGDEFGGGDANSSHSEMESRAYSNLGFITQLGMNLSEFSVHIHKN